MKKHAKNPKKKAPGPARTIIDKCPHRITGATEYPGLTPYPAVWEDWNERQFLTLLRFCEGVVSIESQPQKYSYRYQDKDRIYTPDTLIKTRDGEVLIEVKSLHYLIKPKNLELYTAIASQLRAQGARLQFITDDQMKRTWYRNAYFLRRYLQRDLSAPTIARIEDRLREGPLTIADLCATEETTDLADIYALIAQSKLCFDWDQRLNTDVLVSLPNQPFTRMTYERIRTAGRFADLLAKMALGRRPSDQRLLAATSARRQPLSTASPLGFVEGVDPWRLGHHERQMRRRNASDARQSPESALCADPAATTNEEV